MKPVIAFVTGGYSGESVISYKSAITIENNLDNDKYEVYKIDIRPEGWFHPVPGTGPPASSLSCLLRVRDETS